MMHRATSVALTAILSSNCWAGDTRGAPAPSANTAAQSCIAPAARHHQVNHLLLRAILKVESNLNPRAVVRNGDGTIDVGMGQINSRHFPQLAAYGILPSHLLDPCIGSYVAAWHLSRVIALHGNTWEAVARYHSATPYFNRRYRILLNNELVASGVIPGSRLPVPPLRPASLGPTRPGSPGGPNANQGAVVLDQADALPRFAAAGSVQEAGPGQASR
jgi:soluble lytic murein transglycosylase-like protein